MPRQKNTEPKNDAKSRQQEKNELPQKPEEKLAAQDESVANPAKADGKNDKSSKKVNSPVGGPAAKKQVPGEEPTSTKKKDTKADAPKKSWRTAILRVRTSRVTQVFFCLVVPFITVVTLEWIARGNFEATKQFKSFGEVLLLHYPSYFAAYLFLLFLYLLISQGTGLYALATGIVGLVGNVPAVVTYYKLNMRGEPFLPWDISQASMLAEISSEVELKIQPSMIWTIVIFVVLTTLSAFIKPERRKKNHKGFVVRMAACALAFVGIVIEVFGVFLSPVGAKSIGIYPDLWRQDRYYRNYGVITGFMTNLQYMQIDKPAGYSQQTVDDIVAQTMANAPAAAYYAGSYGATATDAPQTPDIIFVMGESFWDVTRLTGVEYDQEIIPNLTALRENSAMGNVYTPSFGGGTCDVEFEALTGYSVEHLPAGCKPYQQYLMSDAPAYPWYLQDLGYETVAIHGFGRRFWNRDVAYPHLGIEDFIASDNFENPDRKRGFISDDAMADRIIQEYEQRTADGGSVFIHAVTMQNHTTYDPSKYPADELVGINSYPSGISSKVIGELQDCATGIRDMDAAIGKLVGYFETVDRPVILVFWGDHMNPMSDGYTLFEKTGLIESGDTSSPELRQTPLLMWSNYSDQAVDIGVVGSYNIVPVMMDLFGLEKPIYAEFMMQQVSVMHARTRGVTVGPDNSFSDNMSAAQQEAFDQQGILQYDLLFGKQYLLAYQRE